MQVNGIINTAAQLQLQMFEMFPDWSAIGADQLILMSGVNIDTVLHAQ